MDIDLLVTNREQHLVLIGKDTPLSLAADRHLGEIIEAEHNVLRRRHDRLTGCRREQVVCRQHEKAAFELRLERKRHVNRHLVAVEVGIERGTDQRMEADCLPFDEHGEKGLDPEAMQRGCAVEQHRMIFNDRFQNVPHLRTLLLHELFRGFHGLDIASFFELLDDKRFEQLEAIIFGNPHWWILSSGPTTMTLRPE